MALQHQFRPSRCETGKLFGCLAMNCFCQSVLGWKHSDRYVTNALNPNCPASLYEIYYFVFSRKVAWEAFCEVLVYRGAESRLPFSEFSDGSFTVWYDKVFQEIQNMK